MNMLYRQIESRGTLGTTAPSRAIGVAWMEDDPALHERLAMPIGGTLP